MGSMGMGGTEGLSTALMLGAVLDPSGTPFQTDPAGLVPPPLARSAEPEPASSVALQQLAEEQDALRQSAGLLPLERPWRAKAAAEVLVVNTGYEQLMNQVLTDYSVLTAPAAPQPLLEPHAWMAQAAASMDGGAQALAQIQTQLDVGSLNPATEPGLLEGAAPAPETPDSQTLALEELFANPVIPTPLPGEGLYAQGWGGPPPAQSLHEKIWHFCLSLFSF